MFKTIEDAAKPIFNISGSLLRSISLRFLSHDTHIDKVNINSIDKKNIVLANPDLDITVKIVETLNKELPSLNLK